MKTSKLGLDFRHALEHKDITPKLGLNFGNVIKYKGKGTLLPGVIESIKRLKAEMFGDEVYIISRVDDSVNSKKVLENLKKFGIFAIIPEDHVTFCFKREEKAPLAKTIGITHFVDDRTEVLHYMDTVANKYAMNPSAKQLKSFPPFGAVLVESWEDVVSWILDDE